MSANLPHCAHTPPVADRKGPNDCAECEVGYALAVDDVFTEDDPFKLSSFCLEVQGECENGHAPPYSLENAATFSGLCESTRCDVGFKFNETTNTCDPEEDPKIVAGLCEELQRQQEGLVCIDKNAAPTGRGGDTVTLLPACKFSWDGFEPNEDFTPSANTRGCCNWVDKIDPNNVNLPAASYDGSTTIAKVQAKENVQMCYHRAKVTQESWNHLRTLREQKEETEAKIFAANEEIRQAELKVVAKQAELKVVAKQQQVTRRSIEDETTAKDKQLKRAELYSLNIKLSTAKRKLLQMKAQNLTLILKHKRAASTGKTAASSGGSSDKSSGGSSDAGLNIGLIVGALLIIIVVVVVVVVRSKGGAGGPKNRQATDLYKSKAMSFENPLYDEAKLSENGEDSLYDQADLGDPYDMSEYSGVAKSIENPNAAKSSARSSLYSDMESRAGSSIVSRSQFGGDAGYMDMPDPSDGESTTNRPIKKSTDGAYDDMPADYDDMPADDHGYMDMGEGGYSDVVEESGYMDVGESSPSPALESGYMDVGEHGGDNGIYDDAVGEDDMYAGF
jgi:hypothetical protein